jgi:uncharacterized caspase-like protein
MTKYVWGGLLFIFLNLSGCVVDPVEPPKNETLSTKPNEVEEPTTVENDTSPTEPLDLEKPTSPEVQTLLIQNKVALVIGNGNYQIQSLKNIPVNDVHAMKSVLNDLGFTVTSVIDANKFKMENAIDEFIDKLDSGTLGLFYYSGHGVQHTGENFLIPIDAMSKISDPKDLQHAVSANNVSDKMNLKSQLSLIILDTCRDTPFSFAKGKDSGPAPMLSAEGMLIAYATSPGTVALTGSGSNSPYTKHLLRFIGYKLPIEQVLSKVRAAVRHDTSEKQIPWYEASIEGVVIIGDKPPQ